MMSVSRMSIHSEPNGRSVGFTSFKLKAILKGPVLQAEYKKRNPILKAALKGAAGLDWEARAGVLLKYASDQQLDAHHYHVLDSFNISCHSTWGPLDPDEDYVGLVLYSKGGQTDWRANGVHVKSGYIYFRKTSDINHIRSSHGQVHGKLYKSLFRCDPEPDLIAGGFTIREGLQWRFNSGTFNHWQPKPYTMDPKEQAFVKGQAQLPAGGKGRNTLHFEVMWRRKGKAKSIYMRKPAHYLVYQLLLDIQAATGFEADGHELSLDGTTLQWYERLCSAGVQEDDVLVLSVKAASQAAVCGAGGLAALAAQEAQPGEMLSRYLNQQLRIAH